MSHPATGALRWTRSAVMTAVVVGLAATAHIVGGGRLPSPVVFAALLVAVTCVTFRSTRRRLGFGAVTALLVAGQLLLHEALTTFAVSGPTVVATGHVHTPAQVAAELSALSSPVPSSAMVMPADGSASLMVLAHVVATVTTAAVVARGERALWALLAWLSPLAQVLRAVVAVRPRPRRIPREWAVRRPRVLLTARQFPRRGPPARFARA